MKEKSLCQANQKTCWFAYLLLNFFILILMVSSIAQPSWVSQYTQDQLQWKGNLFKVQKGNSNWENVRYQNLAKDYCDLFDQAKISNQSEDLLDFYDGACQLFRGVNRGGAFYIFFQLLSIMGIVITSVIIIALLAKIHCITGTICSTLCTIITHLIASLVYIRASHLTFDGDCSQITIENEPGSVCAQAGPFLLLIIIGLLVVVYIPLGITAIITEAKKNKKVGISSEQRAEERQRLQPVHVQTPSGRIITVITSQRYQETGPNTQRESLIEEAEEQEEFSHEEQSELEIPVPSQHSSKEYRD